MTKDTSESYDKVLLQRPPGYLMAPFGWAAKPLTPMLEAEPMPPRSVSCAARLWPNRWPDWRRCRPS
jgi:hypothetical protein